jgi:hypothetical protein
MANATKDQQGDEAERLIADAQAQAKMIVDDANARAEQIVAEKAQEAVQAATQGGDTAALAVVLARLAETQDAIVEKLGSTTRTETGWRAGMSADDVLSEIAGTSSDDPPCEQRLERPVTFRTRSRNLVVVHKPRHRFTAPNGEVQITNGYRYDFAPTGDFTTDNPVAVAYLRSRPSYNINGGFWEVGNEPGRIPSPEKLLERIVIATRDLDDDALEEIQREEEAQHKREVVIMAVKAARKAILAEPAAG